MTVDLNKMGQAAREASRQLALLGEQKKNQVLETVAQELLAKTGSYVTGTVARPPPIIITYPIISLPPQ